MKTRISLGPTLKMQEKAMARLLKRKRKADEYQRLSEAIITSPRMGSGPPAPMSRWVDALKASEDINKSVRELPYLFYEVCDAYADAVNDQRRSKDRLDEAFAMAEARVWSKQKEGERITVAKAKAIADADPEVIKYTKRYRGATEAVTKLDALKTAFQQKASMLKAEVELIASQFIQRDHVKPRTRALQQPSNYGRERTKY